MRQNVARHGVNVVLTRAAKLSMLGFHRLQCVNAMEILVLIPQLSVVYFEVNCVIVTDRYIVIVT